MTTNHSFPRSRVVTPVVLLVPRFLLGEFFVPTLPRGNACSLHLEVFVNHPVRLRLPPLHRGEFFFFVGTPAGRQNAVYNVSLVPTLPRGNA